METVVPTSFATDDIPEEETNPVSTVGEDISSMFNYNVTGHKWLWDNNVKTHYDKEEFSSAEANEELSGHNLTLQQSADIIETSDSLSEVKDRVEYRKSLNVDAQRVTDLGAIGLAGSLAVSIVDLPSLALGLGVGKAVKAGSTAYQFGKGAHTIAQGIGGAVTGVGSVAMLEASLGEELTTQQMAISGGLGFGIGYAASRLSSADPRHAMQAGKVMADGVESKPNVWTAFNLFRSDADILKQSKNKNASNAGKSATRDTADNRRVNDDWTANDHLANYDKIAQNGNDATFKEIHAQEKSSGQKFTSNDFKQVNHHGLDVDNKLKQDKKIYINEANKKIDADNTKAINTTLKDLEANFKHELTPKGKKPTAKSQRKLEVAKKAKKEELEAKHKEGKEGTQAKINEEAKLRSEANKDVLLSNVPDRYRGAVKAISDMNRKFGQEIDANDLDGLSGKIDTNYHWSRMYDADMIIANPNGAKLAFEKGLRANITEEIDDKLASAIKKQANSIVHKIVNQKSLFEAFDLSTSVVSKEIGKLTPKTGRLKGRVLDLDGTYLTDFMNHDISRNIDMYGKNIGGKLTAKKVYGIDKNLRADEFMMKNNFDSKDMKLFSKVLQSIQGTRTIDENSLSLGSKLTRVFNKLNFINYGGYFGLNTLSDLSNIVYDFGFHRTMKYLTKDIVGTLQKEGKAGAKLSTYLGHAAESSNQRYAANFNGDSFGALGVGKLETGLDKAAGYTSKLSGMNMVIDLMDKTVGIASLDFMMTATRGAKFVKTMNTLGLSPKDIDALRATKNFVKFENGVIKDIDFSKFGDTDLGIKVERAIQRATRDNVLRANSLDTPSFLIEILGSKALASMMFQFLRFPVVAYNKISRKMIHNFEMADAMTATATGAFILGVTTQIKDIGREEKQFDLSTKEGSINMISNIVDRMPYLAPIGLLQSHVDVLGRMEAQLTGEEYRAYDKPITHLGITPARVSDTLLSGRRILTGEGTGRDAVQMRSFMSSNLYWLQPFNHMMNDEIRDAVNE